MTKPLRFGIVAGEKSGDILGASLITALRSRYPNCEFVGVGGPAMKAFGCESLTPMDRLSVMGFVEPLGRLPELLTLKKRLEQRFLKDQIAAFIGIDSPDFNLRLAAALHQHGIKTVHYVSPSVWAYRQKRILKIKQSIDLMLTLFPFETAIYEEHKVRVACVGHPLADQIGFEDNKAVHRQELGLTADAQVIALMPGSRAGEIKRLAPTFLEAAMAALQKFPQLSFVIPYSGVEAKAQISALLRAANIFESDQFQLVDNSHKAISAADMVIMASGTATLEALLLRRPMLICYKVAPLTYAIGSRLLKIPYVGLPNLLAGKRLVPEYLQGQLTASALVNEIENFMTQPAAFADVLSEFERIHKALRTGASDKAAKAITQLVS
jgi:lipid-A-disaccharide synthase